MNKKKTLYRALEKRLMLDASITAIGGNVLWLDAADQATLIDNDGDSVSSGNFNGQIAQWNDKSGNGNDLSHATGSRQPTYTANGKNGNDLVSFDGNDALYISDAAQTGLDLNGNGMTLIAVTKATTTAGSRIIINKESSYEMAFQGGRYQAAISTTAPGGWAWGGTSAISTGWHMTGFTHADTVWTFHQESALTQQIAPANNQTGNIIPSNNIFTVGARGGASPTSSFFQGDMAEVILFDRALTDNERLDIEIYLSDKWGIALNNAAPTVSNSSGGLAQGSSITIGTGMLSSTDTDGADADLIYTVSSVATNGTLKLSGVDLNASDTFTQQDIIDNKLTFDHDGSTVAGSFEFTVNDRINTTAVASFTFALTLKQNVNNPITLDEGGSVTINTADLNFENTDQWYDTDWLYRQKITIDSANIGADLTDFTVLLTQSNMSAAFWADVKADGSDIVITSSDGATKLSRELVDIDTVLETMELHVKLPSISSVLNTDFYLYFGNAAGAEGNDAATWNADHAGVWHLDEAAGNAADATGNGNSGTMVNGTVQGAVGAIGKGVALDGVNDYIDVTINKGASTTLSMWATWDGGANDMLFLAGNYGAGPDLFFVPGANKISLNTWDGSNNAFGAIPASAIDGNFHHYEIVIEAAGAKLYYDGALLGTATYKSVSGTNIFRIGGGDPNYTWGGDIDEVRVVNTALSADWIAAEYANQSNPSNFYSVSAVQTGVTVLTYALNGITDNGALKLNGVDLAINDTFTQTDINSGFITYVHDDTDTVVDLFSFTVSDGSGNITGTLNFDFNINLLNDDLVNNPPAADGAGGANSHNTAETGAESSSFDTIGSSDQQATQLVRSSLFGDVQSAYYSGGLEGIIREGTTIEIQVTLGEINEAEGRGETDLPSGFPTGTPQIVNIFDSGNGEEPSSDNPELWKILEGDISENQEDLDPEQVGNAFILEQNIFKNSVASFLEAIGGQT